MAHRCVLPALFIIFTSGFLGAQDYSYPGLQPNGSFQNRNSGNGFPDLLRRVPPQGKLKLVSNSGPESGQSQLLDETRIPELPSSPPNAPNGKVAPKTEILPSLLENNIIVSFYGSPHSTRMGILGEQSIEETGKLLKAKAKEFDDLNGEQGVIPAFHLIYATVWADANVGVLSDKKVLEYINYAAANDIIVILDHQLGRYSVEDSVRRMLPWLKYPTVHLAIDPEWKTLNPGKEIGSIHAEDVNVAQKLIEDYLEKEQIKQKKLFIVHQFNWKMIMEREKVRTDFKLVDLIHNADGFGSPELKRETYRFVAAAKNMPVKGFKLFFPKAWKSDGFDKPLLTPGEVLNLDPKPVYINYQ